MNLSGNIRNRTTDRKWPTTAALLLGGTLALYAASPVSRPEKPPETPRQFVNAGTARLREGKLREAEAFYESALGTQTDKVRQTALYNLGHVRFGQGMEELKKGPAAGPTAARGRGAAQAADQAIRDAENALAGGEMDRMVASYMQGRGARKQLKEAAKAVQRAMQTHGAALRKWQRSAGDFKSTVELHPSDADAQHNAQVVDRAIAKLVDSIRDLQQCANALADKRQELGEKMEALKGKIPAENMPPGAAGEDEEEEDQPQGPEPGQEEGPSKDGEEMKLSPEQAGWLLEGFRLDTDRRLPMGQENTAEPKDRNRPTW
ncbi:MAG TPA: hypothetical protein VN673_04415 [Clostridia bacterium]|nr:hypothetical protein [Clostridia bacterium]